jgi:acetyl esterase/lipase
VHDMRQSAAAMTRFLSIAALTLVLHGTGLSGQTTTALQSTRIPYGGYDTPTSWGELIVPGGSGPFPIAVLIHGGCWRSTQGTVEQMRPIADMLAAHGVASWNVEYRRVGHQGGGWPGTYRDLSDAVDFIREIAQTYPLNVQKVVVVGHSSGGYFGAWLAGRPRLPAGSPLVGPSPANVSGLLLLDAFLDPGVIDSRGTDGRMFCGEPLLPRLFGGDPDAVPDHVRQASPLNLLPYGVTQEYVVSSLRYPVTPVRAPAAGRTTFPVADYPKLAKDAGDSVMVQIVPDADHFDFLTPSKPAWPAVETALMRIFGIKATQ